VVYALTSFNRMLVVTRVTSASMSSGFKGLAHFCVFVARGRSRFPVVGQRVEELGDALVSFFLR
jgi:hypothetical protein